ncbi:hypothetical protein KALB_3625 [Kutzneria albida DSM 43870]|uniref:ATP-grasp domain-containing protein n=1 Tax=Kutzneria albida DSM 43870 TaxID=1449976 RepID=W5WFN7_9PSEU|nr:hypothetical protein KALB_3625 [Kutzneria albida DSM 43870]
MHVCVLGDTADHPSLTALREVLSPAHSVEVLDPHTGATDAAVLSGPDAFADVYLLTARTARAIALGRGLRERGALVINDPTAAAVCQHRVHMARRAAAGGLAFAPTLAFPRLSELVARMSRAGRRTTADLFPVVVKSTRRRRGELVVQVENLHELRALEPGWAREPVVVQSLLANDGWERKLWVVGGQVYSALRRSPLDADNPPGTSSLPEVETSGRLRELALHAGKVFSLEVCGVDALLTQRGPVLVDVNAFPCCAALPGVPEALAALLLDAAARRARRLWTSSGRGAPAVLRPSPVVPEPGALAGLHHAVTKLVRAGHGRAELKVTRVRRKRGGGLVATYLAAPGDAAASPQIVVASLTERAVSVPGIGAKLADLGPAEPRDTWPNTFRSARCGLVVRPLAEDERLPGMRAALAPVPGSRLADQLAAACRLAVGDPGLRVLSIQATPVRYEPGSRCLVRYRIAVRPGTASRPHGELVLYGKVYRDIADAAAAHLIASHLWRAAAPFVARPLAALREFGLALSEAAGGAAHRGSVNGRQVLRPGRTEVDPGPFAAAAAVLAGLHTSGVPDGVREIASGPRTAVRVREWAELLAGQVPELAGDLGRLLAPLTAELSVLVATPRALVHGAFKPGQLIFTSPTSPVVGDFDGACAGDPALDLGCFLAHLRPRGNWARSAEGRAWYSSVRQVFLGAYVEDLRAAGLAPAVVAGIRRRADLFQAATLLKIASRQARRLGSPRPEEIGAAVAGARDCLRRFDSWAEGTW